MKKRYEPVSQKSELRDKLIGLGESTPRKSYYPELQLQLDKLQERVRLAELSAEIGRGLTEEKSLRRSLQRCSDALASYTDAALVRIWVLDEFGEYLQMQASSGLHTSIEGWHSLLRVEDYPHKVGIIARDKKPFLTNDVTDRALFHDQDWIAQHALVAFAGYPLVLQKELVGVIALFAQRPLEATVLQTLENIRNQIAVSINRFQLLDAYKAALANAREGHEKVNGILRSVADALLVIDHRKRILHMNQAAEALLGTSLTTSVNRPIGEVIFQLPLLNYLEQVVAGTTTENDLELYDTARDQMRVIEAHAAQLKSKPSDSGLVVSLRDVTQEREVARLKSEFISTAAHELRTPLSSISGFAELLCSDTWSEEQRSEFLHTILEKSESLARIIDDLLDLSRIESGRGLSLRFSEWDLAPTLHKIVSRRVQEHPAYHFEHDVPEDLGSIQADRDKIVQAVENLLSNAIKYSPAGKPISLCARRDDDSVTIRVEDRGIGMNAEQRAHCFEKFYRADSSNTAVGGLGLGLSIVRYVVRAHRGTIEVASTPGEGTCMTLTLPLRFEDALSSIDDEAYFADLFHLPSTNR